MFCSIYLLIKNNLYNILYLIINKIYWSYTINTQLVIFDLDGTLCDTFDDIYLSLKHSLDNFNVFTPSLNEVKSFIGDGLALLIERTLNVTNQAYLKNDILASFMQYYKEHCTDSTLLFPGMENVLKELYKKNVYMAVVSNKAYHLVDIIIKELDLIGLGNEKEYVRYLNFWEKYVKSFSKHCSLLDDLNFFLEINDATAFMMFSIPLVKNSQWFNDLTKITNTQINKELFITCEL